MTNAYRSYIKSAKWRRRRDRYFKTHKKVCKACGYGKKIHLHHLHYDNLGAEKDIDLLPLCAMCHRAVHRLQSEQRVSIASATACILKLKKRNSRKPLKKNQRKKKSERIKRSRT